MRELTVGEIELVDGGVAPLVWAVVTLGSAAIGAVGGWLAGSSAEATVTVTADTTTIQCSSSVK